MPPEAPPVVPSRRTPLPLAAATTAVLLVVLGAALAVLVAPTGRILANTSVGGVPVGRLDAPAARAVLAAAGPDLAATVRGGPAELAVTTPDGVRLVPTAALPLALDLDATVARALAVGRSGGPRDLLIRLRALRVPTDVPPVLAPDADAVRATVDALAAELDRPPDVGDLRVDPRTLAVTVVPPRRGVAVRRDEAVRALTAAVTAARSTVTLPADVAPVAAPAGAVAGLGASLQLALDRGLVLVGDAAAGGARVVIAPAELAGAVSVVPGRDAAGAVAPVLHLDRTRIARTVGVRLVAALAREPVDARIAVPAAPRFTAMGSAVFRPVPVDVALDPGRPGLRFRMDRTARQLEAMIAAGRRTAPADLEPIAPGTTAEDLAAHPLPTHLLGTFTTFHPAGADRNVNIRRLADTLDGTLVAPGAELSINGVSGERRCEDGYLPAGTIVFGELVDTCGGGVSQFGTTTYNAAFFAGLPTVQWQAHSFYIGRYPMGREATLSFPELDVRAVNDTDGWLLVTTSHTPTSVTVTLHGVPRWGEVRAVHGPPTAPTPFPTELRPAPDLAPGEERVLQPGGDGFTIEVTRVRTPTDGGPGVSERTRTVYRPQTRIVEVAPGTPVTVDPGPAVGTGTGVDAS